jgi:hypothetical protein
MTLFLTGGRASEVLDLERHLFSDLGAMYMVQGMPVYKKYDVEVKINPLTGRARSDLQAHFLRFRPNIIHFSGHGTESSQIILENDQGYSTPVQPKALSDLFKLFKKKIKVVILNSCYSGEQAESIAEHIPYVIGMTNSISDETAIKFSPAFYRALGYGESVEKAFNLAKNQLELENISESDIPILIMRR